MDHLSNPEQPAYVADRVSAVSNVPMQFLMSVGMVAVILVAASLTDAIPAGEGMAGLPDAQTTSSIVGRTARSSEFAGPTACRETSAQGTPCVGKPSARLAAPPDMTL
jgi:hypothetical protein